jgi:sulfopyruvate decarboxylase TPP-binding subunit
LTDERQSVEGNRSGVYYVIEQLRTQTRPRHDLSFGQSGARYRQQTIEGLYDGFRSAGIDFVVFMPDATMDGIEQTILERGEIEAYQCVREDEGIAMAMGAYMVGRRPVVLMEGSGIGLSGIILARSVLQRCPMLLVAGHCATLGERYDYHASTRMVVEPVLRAVGVPCHTVMDPAQVKLVVEEGQRTVDGQKIPFGILLPNHVIREDAE